MSEYSNKYSGPGFSTCNLPGSVAEQKEAERLAEFQRCKALRKAEEEGNRPAEAAEREAVFQAETAAQRKKQRPRAVYPSLLKP